MSPVDSIRPPRKSNKPITTAKPAAKVIPVQKIIRQEQKTPATQMDMRHKERLLWILVTGTALIIFLAWLFIFPSPSLKSNNQSYWGGVSQKLEDLWKSISTDILHFKSSTNNANANTEEERINQLENQVFPQFNDPTKQ